MDSDDRSLDDLGLDSRKVSCPVCEEIFEASLSQTSVHCPVCDSSFVPQLHIKRPVEPTLSELGLDSEVQKTSQIERLQRESEMERHAKNARVIAENRGYWVCRQCGRTGYPATLAKSDFGSEMAVWLVCLVATCFFPPALLVAFVFSIWRFATKYKGCPSCKAGNMIPNGSPEARKIL